MRAAKLDGWGIGLASLCVVHCLALPVMFAALPALADLFVLPEAFHLLMVALAVPVSGAALLRGHRLHRRPLPPLIGAAGLALMVGALGLSPDARWETGLTVAGSLMLVGAHWGNWRLHRR